MQIGMIVDRKVFVCYYGLKKSLGDVAKDNLMDLIKRSLVIL